MFAEGDKAPDFALPDRSGGRVVLYFYPKAGTGIKRVDLP